MIEQEAMFMSDLFPRTIFNYACIVLQGLMCMPWLQLYVF